MMAKHPKPPAITNHMPISVRAYAKPKVDKSKKAEPPQKHKRKASPLPASPWVIVVDTETLTGPSQSLRFGTYQVRCEGELKEAGIFYEPDGVSGEELAMLEQYALAHGLKLITRDEFADRVFYGIGYEYRACLVGFNLPFDISRIAIGHNSARTEMRGGFSFKLTKDKRKPNIQLKHGQKFSFMRFAAPMRQLDNRSDRRRGRKNPVRRGHFLDIGTLASAMFAKPFSLKDLSVFLKVPNPKLEFEHFDGPITEDMVTYAVRDAQTTWECYVELIKRYEQLGLPNAPPEKIYSEASLGKANLKAMNILPWQKCQPDFPDQLLARILATYLGGRSEVRIRREIREVILCDFLSMYPTVCTLMKLWNFVIAKGMTWRDTTVEIRAWLEKIDLKAFKSQTTWQQLTTLVRVHPDADIFPLRASYGDGDQTTIGVNYVSSDMGLWFTLADCAASKLLSGKVPEILEAITFTPMDPQGGLQSVRISGKVAYEVNPATDDFYKRAIEMRQETKDRRDAEVGAEKEALDTEQNALKIAVNATSYGVFVEVNVADMTEEVELSVLSGTDEPFAFKAMKVEEPGPFFHPLLATLITGAARLMLALTETLVEQEALEWAFCDTDSMAIAKPIAMDTAKFHARVHRIVDWFDDLNPYDFKEKILKVEDVNFDIENTRVLRPLYCWAVSAKRYALFNLDGDNIPIIRKASGHGLGHLREPYTAKNPAVGIPKSVAPVHKIGKGFKVWQHDIWWQIVTSALENHPNKVNLSFHQALDLPAIVRFGLTTPHLLRYFKKYNQGKTYRDQAKPFGFMTGLTAHTIDDTENLQPEPGKRRRKTMPCKPIAPFTRDPEEAARTAFDRETGLPVPAGNLKTFKEALASYHMQHENKFLNGSFRNQGTTRRRHVMVTGVRHIGKEANRLEEQMMLGMDEDANPDYGMSPDQVAAMIAELREFKNELGVRHVADMLGISRYQFRQLLVGKFKLMIPLTALINLRAKANAHKASELAHLQEIRTSVAVMGLRTTARLLKRDPSNLKRKLRDNS